MMINNRIKTIFKNSDHSLDAIIIMNSTQTNIDLNFFYATGLSKGLYEGCIAILFPTGEIDIIITPLESELAKKSNLNQRIYNTKNEYIKQIKESLKSHKNIGINGKSLTLNDFNFLKSTLINKEIKDISSSLVKSRMIKDEYEISQIKKACEISDKVIQKIPQIIHEKITEDELAAEINYLMQKYGADKEAFSTISSMGKNTALPHYTHSNQMIKENDLVLCDFGARLNRYNSDITRTFIYGKASEEHREIYHHVFKAQQLALNAIKPGIKANQIHQIVDQYINDTSYEGKFIHSTGHSLGMAVHDEELGFNNHCEIVLEKNMVLTVEPGIYVLGFGGIRIEDDIRITENGCEIITKSDKQLIEI
jgi:Xaa-Pro dipeptidase